MLRRSWRESRMRRDWAASVSGKGLGSDKAIMFGYPYKDNGSLKTI